MNVINNIFKDTDKFYNKYLSYFINSDFYYLLEA